MIKASKLRKSRRLQRRRRHTRIRKKVHGTGERPRLAVYRSLRNIEGQVIDDDRRHTLVGLSTLAPELRDAAPNGRDGKIGAARAAGKLLAERACERGVTRVVFDRGGYRYHGRVRAFAEGAREGGLIF
ncbi:MAG: 50S ribosomal protein L18 [Gemmatimonadetes bacterium]|nr:50S ribosomal protein L18 [Gemmatimonadota bacterium]MDE2679104.1 50S ribosomal protein L18 [Gemmatimonadota bacterium]MXX34756.1 50S ribosomal protein L18 [Gemmatimonadota bacterium]MYD15477.1 50S ribosomal protein L18 [Gemmatimonadota bacterium]MYI66359.1 50S ribosomal protein L18 [Gemmatimonadota bacterium]